MTDEPMIKVERPPKPPAEIDPLTRAFLPVTPDGIEKANLRVFPGTGSVYLRDPETGRMTRLNKPLNKKQRKALRKRAGKNEQGVDKNGAGERGVPGFGHLSTRGK